jgi:hypothetical protein
MAIGEGAAPPHEVPLTFVLLEGRNDPSPHPVVLSDVEKSLLIKRFEYFSQLIGGHFAEARQSEVLLR